MSARMIAAGIGIVLVGLVVAGLYARYWVADSQHVPSAAWVTAKKSQLAALEKLDAAKLAPDGSAYNPLERDTGLRDAGRRGVGLFVRHAYFRIAGDIGFDVGTLSARLVPTTVGDPVVLDDPQSFVFKPMHGDVVMPARALAALFNQYLTDYPETQLRRIRVETSADGLLEVTGQTKKVPGLWLPFTMRGPVALVDHHLFVYTPDKIDIAKIPVKGLLELIRLQLARLVRIDTQGAELAGNTIVLDLNHALPPPAQDVRVSDLSIDTAGVHLSFTSPFDPEWPQPVVDTDSYLLFDGGDIRTQRSLITHVRMQMIAADGGRLDTSLYNYRQQLTGGHLRATTAGELVAHLAALETADYVPPADPTASESDDDPDTPS